MRVLTDADVDRVPMARLVAAVREQIIADAQGEAVAPPRHVVPFREGSLVFTIGGDRRLAGFRAYQTFGRPGHATDTQVVAAWDQVKTEMIGSAPSRLPIAMPIISVFTWSQAATTCVSVAWPGLPKVW